MDPQEKFLLKLQRVKSALIKLDQTTNCELCYQLTKYKIPNHDCSKFRDFDLPQVLIDSAVSMGAHVEDPFLLFYIPLQIQEKYAFSKDAFAGFTAPAFLCHSGEIPESSDGSEDYKTFHEHPENNDLVEEDDVHSERSTATSGKHDARSDVLIDCVLFGLSHDDEEVFKPFSTQDVCTNNEDSNFSSVHVLSIKTVTSTRHFVELCSNLLIQYPHPPPEWRRSKFCMGVEVPTIHCETDGSMESLPVE